MLSKESKQFIEEFLNDERYETLCEELKETDEVFGVKFERIFDKVSKLGDEDSVEEEYEDESEIPEIAGKKKGKMIDEDDGGMGLSIYLAKAAKKKGY